MHTGAFHKGPFEGFLFELVLDIRCFLQIST